MELAIYIQGTRLDLFDDESVLMNLGVKNVSDISKVKIDYTQTFNVPASPSNNQVFTHWYDASIDGTFNANLRINAYIEINSLPFRYGSIQLMESKIKKGSPYSYSITFFSIAVNLSDLFADDTLADLDLSFFDHPYTANDVVNAMRSLSIDNGDIYYPLISAVNEMSIGTTGTRDLIDPDNEITYRELKPALREIRIIEAIEIKYGVKFSRDFFGRVVFSNRYLWLHKESGAMKAFGTKLTANITGPGSLGDIGVSVSIINDTITYQKYVGITQKITLFKVMPAVGFEEVPYKIFIENNGVQISENEFTGANTAIFSDGIPGIDNVLKFKVQAAAEFNFTTRILVRRNSPVGHTDKATSTPLQTVTGRVVVSEQIPDMKVKEYLNSLISEFNLILVPVKENEFIIDSLTDWYDKGKAYDITALVDIDETTVKRADVKKQIDFVYSEAGTILAKRYQDNNDIGYGDLRAKFDQIAGNELKIESQFENMLFERLPNEATGELTDLQAGYSIDSELKPYKGKPIHFYRNGWTYAEVGQPIYISGIPLGRIFHTASENNILIEQVTSSVNFGSDTSSYLYQPIERSLYFNFWKSFIEDLYNRKTRVYTVKCKLPIYILYPLSLNDRFIIKDVKYKISIANINLLDGQTTLELFSDFSPPIDSVNDIIPITVDSTEYTVDSELLTVDMNSLHLPNISYIVNSISISNYISTGTLEAFEVKVTANTSWTVTKIDTGDGTAWFGTDITNGKRTAYVTAKTISQATLYRSGILRFTIGTDVFDLTINQLPT